MPYNLATIRTQLKTLLQTVTEVAFVYDRRNPNIEGYPAIIFDVTRSENEMLTNTENLRTIMFTIYLIAEVGQSGAAQANSYLDTVTKKVVEALEDVDNITLSGNVDWMMPVEGDRTEQQSPQGDTVWQQLDLRVKVASSVL